MSLILESITKLLVAHFFLANRRSSFDILDGDDFDGDDDDDCGTIE